MSHQARAYRFKTAAQWQRCLAEGFDISKPGALQPIARLGSTAGPTSETRPVTLVAADRFAGPTWRIHANGQAALVRFVEVDRLSRAFEVDATLAASPRWLLDDEWLWAFDVGQPIVRRYERETMDEDLAVDLRELSSPSLPEEFGRGVTIRDLASDGHEGIWLLLEGTSDTWWLLHVDCFGKPRELDPVPVRCAPERPMQLGTVARGTRLVLVATDGRLTFVNAGDGRVLRVVSNWRDDPCWRVHRMATDGVNRIALLCRLCDDDSRWAVFVLDADGDTLDSVTGPQSLLKPRPDDAAIANGVLWLAGDEGLWRLDSSEASMARESSSVLLTPALLSPRAGAGAGWLRAEIAVDLPRGAVIEAEAVTSNSECFVNEVTALFADQSQTVARRQQVIWDRFDHPARRVYHVTAGPGKGQPVAVPLFESVDRWLWLRLKLVTPPGVAPPEITELRVFYPDASIARHLPAAFLGSRNDPTGFLRSLVGVLETTTQGIDEAIRSIAAQIDSGTAPGPWLDYIARWMDLPWDDALPLAAKRGIVRSAGALLAQRGTRRGLELLLGALAGPGARIRVVDLTVDHPPTRLGGPSCGRGPRLPMLLAGALRTAPILGTYAVLGRACLGVPADPLRSIAPTLQIAIAAPRTVQRTVAPIVQRVLAQYVPAGVKAQVAWTTVTEWAASGAADDGELLDANGPGRLDEDSEIGRIVLSGRAARRVDDAGLDVGFRLS